MSGNDEHDEGKEEKDKENKGHGYHDWKMETFVIIDVRSEEEFVECHINGALHLPLDVVKQDRFPAFMYSFKRDASKRVIVYSKNEKEASLAATIMTEKGYDNCSMLSGAF